MPRRLLLKHQPDRAQDDILAVALKKAVVEQQRLAGQSSAVVNVLDLVSDSEGFWLEEETEGARNLESLLAEAPLDPRRVVRIGIRLCEGLIQNCYPLGGSPRPHGSIRPHCVFARDAEILISDFGIASAVIDTIGAAGAREDLDVPAPLAPYVAPEAWIRDARGELQDLFAVGIILFELATDCHPYGVDREDYGDCEFLIVSGAATPARESNPDFEPEFANVLDKAVTRNENRYPSLAELLDALQQVAGPDPVEDVIRSAAQADVTDQAALDDARQSLKQVLSGPVGDSERRRLTTEIERIDRAGEHLVREQEKEALWRAALKALEGGQLDETSGYLPRLRPLDDALARKLEERVKQAWDARLAEQLLKAEGMWPDSSVSLASIRKRITAVATNPHASRDIRAQAESLDVVKVDYFLREAIAEADDLLSRKELQDAGRIHDRLRALPDLEKTHIASIAELKQRIVDEQASLRKQLALAREWCSALGALVKGEDTVAADAHLNRRPRLSVTWPKELRIVEERCRKELGRLHKEETDKAASLSRGKMEAWFRQIDEAIRLKRWDQAERQLEDRPTLDPAPPELEQEVASRRHEITGGRRQYLRERDEKLAKKWTDRIEPAIQGEDWKRSVQLLDERPRLEYPPDGWEEKLGGYKKTIERGQAEERTRIEVETERAKAQEYVGSFAALVEAGRLGEALMHPSRRRPVLKYPWPEECLAEEQRIQNDITRRLVSRQREELEKLRREVDQIRIEHCPEGTLNVEPGAIEVPVERAAFVLASSEYRTLKLVAVWDPDALVFRKQKGWDPLLRPRRDVRKIARKAAAAVAVIAAATAKIARKAEAVVRVIAAATAKITRKAAAGVPVIAAATVKIARNAAGVVAVIAAATAKIARKAAGVVARVVAVIAVAVAVYLVVQAFRPPGPLPHDEGRVAVHEFLLDCLPKYFPDDDPDAKRYVTLEGKEDARYSPWIVVSANSVREPSTTFTVTITSLVGTTYTSVEEKNWADSTLERGSVLFSADGEETPLRDLCDKLATEALTQRKREWKASVADVREQFRKDDRLGDWDPLDEAEGSPDTGKLPFRQEWPVLSPPPPLDLERTGRERTWNLTKAGKKGIGDLIKSAKEELRRRAIEAARGILRQTPPGEAQFADYVSDEQLEVRLPDHLTWGFKEGTWSTTCRVDLKMFRADPEAVRASLRPSKIFPDAKIRLDSRGDSLLGLSKLSDDQQAQIRAWILTIQQAALSDPVDFLDRVFPSPGLPALTDPTTRFDAAYALVKGNEFQATLIWDPKALTWQPDDDAIADGCQRAAEDEVKGAVGKIIAGAQLGSFVKIDEVTAQSCGDGNGSLETVSVSVTITDAGSNAEPGAPAAKQVLILSYPQLVDVQEEDMKIAKAKIMSFGVPLKVATLRDEACSFVMRKVKDLRPACGVETVPAASTQSVPEGLFECELSSDQAAGTYTVVVVFDNGYKLVDETKFENDLAALCPKKWLSIVDDKKLWNDVRESLHWPGADDDRLDDSAAPDGKTETWTVEIRYPWAPPDGPALGEDVPKTHPVRLDLQDIVALEAMEAYPEAPLDTDAIADAVRAKLRVSPPPYSKAADQYVQLRNNGFLLEKVSPTTENLKLLYGDFGIEPIIEALERLAANGYGSEEPGTAAEAHDHDNAPVHLEGKPPASLVTDPVQLTITNPRSELDLDIQIRVDISNIALDENQVDKLNDWPPKKATHTIRLGVARPKGLLEDVAFGDVAKGLEEAVDRILVVNHVIAHWRDREALETEIIGKMPGAGSVSEGVSAQTLATWLDKLDRIKRLEPQSALTLEDRTKKHRAGTGDPPPEDKTHFIELFWGLRGRYALTWIAEPDSGNTVPGTTRVLRLEVDPAADADSLLASPEIVQFLSESHLQSPVDGCLGVAIGLDGYLARSDFEKRIPDVKLEPLEVALKPTDNPQVRNTKKITTYGTLNELAKRNRSGFWYLTGCWISPLNVRDRQAMVLFAQLAQSPASD